MKKLTKFLILFIGILVGIFILYDNTMAQPNPKGNGNPRGNNDYVHKPDFEHPKCYRWCDPNSKHFDQKQCDKHCNGNNVPIDGGILFLMITGTILAIIRIKQNNLIKLTFTHDT